MLLKEQASYSNVLLTGQKLFSEAIQVYLGNGYLKKPRDLESTVIKPTGYFFMALMDSCV